MFKSQQKIFLRRYKLFACACCNVSRLGPPRPTWSRQILNPPRVPDHAPTHRRFLAISESQCHGFQPFSLFYVQDLKHGRIWTYRGASNPFNIWSGPSWSKAGRTLLIFPRQLVATGLVSFLSVHKTAPRMHKLLKPWEKQIQRTSSSYWAQVRAHTTIWIQPKAPKKFFIQIGTLLR